MAEMSEVVFEGDEPVASRAFDGNLPTARSSVADLLLRSHVVRSERQAQWMAVGVALIAIGLVIGAAIWAGSALGSPDPAKPFSQMTEAERDALPIKHRVYLERLERAEREQRDRIMRDSRVAPATQN
jgi:hypothetical protein